MFKCKFPHDDIEEFGFYIETVIIDEHDGHNPYAVVLHNTKLFLVPLDEVTWTNWVD